MLILLLIIGLCGAWAPWWLWIVALIVDCRR